MNNKGEVKISTVVISCLMFLLFLTSAIVMVGDFFSYDTNLEDSSYNESYFSGLDDSRLDTNGSNANEFLETTTGMSDDIFYNNDSVGDSTPEDIMNYNTLSSFKRLPSIFNFVKNVLRDTSEKMGIPEFFIIAISLIVLIIIIFGTLSALRGIK